MSDLSLVGALSEERGEEEANVCLDCGAVVPQHALGAVWIEGKGACCDEECYQRYQLQDQRVNPREAIG